MVREKEAVESRLRDAAAHVAGLEAVKRRAGSAKHQTTIFDSTLSELVEQVEDLQKRTLISKARIEGLESVLDLPEKED